MDTHTYLFPDTRNKAYLEPIIPNNFEKTKIFPTGAQTENSADSLLLNLYKLHTGDILYMDHYQSTLKGILIHTKFKEN